MAIEPTDFLPASRPIQFEALSQTPASNFESWMSSQFNQINDKLIDAEQQVRQLAVGDADNLHQVMITLEETKLSFQLAMQVRARVLDAYQEVLRMQV